jgi:hypothetical protein
MENPAKNYKNYFRGALVVCGLLTVGLASALIYIVAPVAPVACGNTITVPVAHDNLDLWMKDPKLNVNGIKAVVLERADFNAMTCINNANLGNIGYRIYFGLSASGALTRSIVGMMPNGSDNTTLIYQVNPTTQALCPPICDNAGPIGIR